MLRACEIQLLSLLIPKHSAHTQHDFAGTAIARIWIAQSDNLAANCNNNRNYSPWHKCRFISIAINQRMCTAAARAAKISHLTISQDSTADCNSLCLWKRITFLFYLRKMWNSFKDLNFLSRFSLCWLCVVCHFGTPANCIAILLLFSFRSKLR